MIRMGSPASVRYQSPVSFVCPQETTTTNSLFSDTSSSVDAMSVYARDSSPHPNLSNADNSQKKKRKSWGQVLPKPTTNLPPRKRAKTEEEKAQRKYERVQRNRHAAHMSRMRKQEEMDLLKEQNARLQRENAALKQQLRSLGHECGPFNAPPSPPASQEATSPVMRAHSAAFDDDDDDNDNDEDDEDNEPPTQARNINTNKTQNNRIEGSKFVSPPYSPITPPVEELQLDEEFGNTQSAELCSQQWMPDSTHSFHQPRISRSRRMVPVT